MYKKPQGKDLGNIHLFNLFSVATTIHKAPKDPCFLVFKPCVMPSIIFLEARRLKQGIISQFLPWALGQSPMHFSQLWGMLAVLSVP